MKSIPIFGGVFFWGGVDCQTARWRCCCNKNGVKDLHAFSSGTVEHEEWDGSHAAVKTHTPLKRVGQPVPKLQRKIDVGFALLLMGSEAQVDLTEAVLCCIRSRPDSSSLSSSSAP